MNSAKTNTKMLFFKDNRHILEYTICYMVELILFKAYRLELYVLLIRNLLQGARLLELIGAAHALQVREHQLHVHENLRCRTVLPSNIYFEPKLANVIEFYLFFLVSNHEGARQEVLISEIPTQYVVMVLHDRG